MVQYAMRDELFPEAGMLRAHAIIGERYRDAPESYAAVFAEVPHSFDVPMQERAFDWLAAGLRVQPPPVWPAAARLLPRAAASDRRGGQSPCFQVAISLS
ncbi:hypothetical protein ACFQ0B_00825 [Nonomuraea thailandensis]